MTILSIIKPESLTEFKKHLQFMEYIDLYHYPKTNEIIIRSHINRTTNDKIKTEYFLIYKLPGSISIRNSPKTQITIDPALPTHIHISGYPDHYQLKTLLSMYTGRDTESLFIEAYPDNTSERFEKLNLIQETISINLKDSAKKSSHLSTVWTDLKAFTQINNIYETSSQYKHEIITFNNTKDHDHLTYLQTNTTIIW